MKKIITILLASLASFSSAYALKPSAYALQSQPNISSSSVTATFRNINENITIENPDFSNWKEAWRNFKNGVGIIEYVPKDQNINNWHDLFTVEYFTYDSTNGKNTPVKNWVNRYMNALISVCPKGKISTPEILNQQDDEITIFWNAKGCGTDNVSANQVEITRFMQGAEGMHIVRYTVKGDSVTDETKQKMLTFVNAAYIEDKN